MKTVALWIPAGFLLTAAAFAQTRPSTNVPPPPGINDPGVTAVAPPSPSSTASPKAAPLNLKPQTLPAMRDDRASSDRDPTLPDIQTHRRGDDVVQEYSRSGQVYMIVVTPKNGIQQTYMVDPQGRIVDDHGQKKVGPVMYKVLEWGKAKPADASSTDAPSGNDGN